jgi:DNA-3-methyladenine glycosylase II
MFSILRSGTDHVRYAELRGILVNLKYDPAQATAHLLAADPVLAGVVEQVGPLQIRHSGRPYEALVRSILYQQLAGPAAAAIERRFLALYGDDGRVPTPEEMLSTSVETFRTAGVSRQKAGYLLDLAAKTHEGVVGDHLVDMPDEEVATHVMAVKGIGRWTADMLLIFCLGRPDILPVGDLGLRNAVKRLYNHPEHLPPKELEALAEPWRPYRSAATWYLWQWLDIRLPDAAPVG